MRVLLCLVYVLGASLFLVYAAVVMVSALGLMDALLSTPIEEWR